MIFQNAFDNIVHEHIEYYHFSVLEYMLKKHGLKAVDVSLNDSNGGSIRVFVKHANQLVDENSEKHLLDLRSSEKKLHLNTEQPFKNSFKDVMN